MLHGYDIFMLIVLGAAVVWGAWKGLAWQLASLASIALSYFVALNFRGPVSQAIRAEPPWNMFLAMLILFIGTSLAVWIVFNFLAEFIERVRLKEFDRQIGALFGLAKGVLLCVIITLFAVTLLDESKRQAICNSRSGYYIAALLQRADAVLPPEIHHYVDPYLNNLDPHLGANPYDPAQPTPWGQPQYPPAPWGDGAGYSGAAENDPRTAVDPAAGQRWSEPYPGAGSRDDWRR